MNLNPVEQYFIVAPVTFFLMVIVFIVSLKGFFRPNFFMKLVLHPYSIFYERQYYRLITADLVHNDLLHLVVNEIMMYGICSNLEEDLRLQAPHGSMLFLVIYLSSCLTGAMITSMLNRGRFEYSSAGGSGSLLGCMMSLMLLKPNQVAIYLPMHHALNNKYTALLVIALLVYYQIKSGNNRISYEVHFFGAIGGILITLILFPHIII
jgi:membrane associated rhomboid family serine protease